MTSENEFLPNSEILSYLSVFQPFQSFTGNYIETRLGLLTGLVYMVASKSQQFIDRSSHRRCSVRIGVLRISQNSQENTCARASFLIKFETSGSFCWL